MEEDLGKSSGKAEAETGTEAFTKACKEVVKNWPIEIAWVTSTIPFKGKTLGPFFLVKVSRDRPEENQERLLKALRDVLKSIGENEAAVTLMDSKGVYAPFTEPVLKTIEAHFNKNPPEVVWRSPTERAKVKASSRGKRSSS